MRAPGAGFCEAGVRPRRRRVLLAGVMPSASAKSSSVGVGPPGSGDGGSAPDVASATLRSVGVSPQDPRSPRRCSKRRAAASLPGSTPGLNLRHPSAATVPQRQPKPAGHRVPRSPPPGPCQHRREVRTMPAPRRPHAPQPMLPHRQEVRRLRSRIGQMPRASPKLRRPRRPGLASSPPQLDPSGPPNPIPRAVPRPAAPPAGPPARAGSEPRSLAPHLSASAEARSPGSPQARGFHGARRRLRRHRECQGDRPRPPPPRSHLRLAPSPERPTLHDLGGRYPRLVCG